jgi:phosphotriesterase-related protein
MATDIQRVREICNLVEKGHVARILVSGDICHKNMLHAYGGWGYDHVITNVIPMFLEHGLSRANVKALTEDNPRKFLSTSIDAPKEL